jgi:uncharacterized protein (DUF2147 family)
MRPTNLLLLLAVAVGGVTGAPMASARGPQGIWLVDGEAAVQIDDCSGLLCGRLLWLQTPHDADGKLKRDTRNPNPAMRQCILCGLTLIWNLHAIGPGQWDDGRFYNPASGNTYDMKMELSPFDALVARFYKGSSLVGETKTLSRILHGTSEGWC